MARKLEGFRKGLSEIDLAEITFRKRTGDRSIAFSGPGQLRHTKEGLQLVCHAQMLDEHDALSSFIKKFNTSAGEIVRDDEYFDTEATDFDENHWVFNPLDPDENWSVPLSAGILRAKVRTARVRLPPRTSSAVLKVVFDDQAHGDWAVFNDDIKIKLEDHNLDCILRTSKSESHLITVEVTAVGAFPDTFERRFIEALEFIHGASLMPTLIEHSSSTFQEIEVRNTPPPVLRSHALPPIETRDVSLKPAVEMLLGKYLNVLLSDPESVTSHPCSRYLALARPNSRDINAWAIGVSVAAEGIAKLLPAPPIETNGDLQELRTDILNFMQAGSYDEALKARIAGTMKGLDSPSPKGRMYALVAAGEVLAEDIKAWSGLRNKAVHTPGRNVPAVSNTSFQQLIDAIHTVYRLLHMMTFSLIGYRGDFTDYAMRGFPTRQFPAPTAIPKDNGG